MHVDALSFWAIVPWWYTRVPVLVGYHQRLFLLTVLDYFSFGVLIRTLFAPWKRDELIATGQTSLGERLQLVLLNLMGRLIGAIVRTLALAVGAVAVLIVLLFFVMLWVAWVLAPFIGLGLVGLGLGSLTGALT